jgi:nucleotide-binding universal stress UspA family protein
VSSRQAGTIPKTLRRLATLAVSDTILTQVAELDADLPVMGAYSHSRFREIILGGTTTHDILRDMHLPVRMTH